MALKDTLKLQLPIYQRGNPELDELLESVGELLDGFKTAINNIQTYSDFQLIDEGLIDALAKQFDVEFPRNMSEERRRSYLREIVTLYRSKGSEVSMQRIFRIIGWEVTIEEYYVIDPSWFASPTDTYTIMNEQGATFELGLYDRLAEGQLTYKNSQVFVDLVDTVGNTYPKRQIYGQTYEVNEDITFMKVPYIKILVKSEDFDLFTSNYVEDGNLYGYESSEEFEILESIKDYFLEKNRPASVAIIDISTPFNIADTFSEPDGQYVIELNGQGTYTGNLTYSASENSIVIDAGGGTAWADNNFQEGDFINIVSAGVNTGQFKIRKIVGDKAFLYINYPVVDGTSVSGTVTNEYFTIMTSGATPANYDGTIGYGVTTDRYFAGETFGNFTYGEAPFDYYCVCDEAPHEQYTNNYAQDALGAQLPLLIRRNSTVTITNPADRDYVLYATTDDLFKVEAGTANWENMGARSGTVTAEVTALLNYRAVYIHFDNQSSITTTDVTVDLLT